MLDPAFAFSAAGLLAMVGWLALVAALFVAGLRTFALAGARYVVPALLAIAYILLIFAGMRESSGGGFGSIPEVRALFASDAALAAGWLHYLAFDLFVGSWIVEDGLSTGISPWLLIPCLALTFLFGPAGLLLYLVLRVAARRRSAARS